MQPKTKNATPDEIVQKMMKTWDTVTCHICKKRISMLEARLINEKYFICKKGH